MKVLKGRGGGDGGFSQVGCVGFTFKHMINYVDINKSDSPQGGESMPARQEVQPWSNFFLCCLAIQVGGH